MLKEMFKKPVYITLNKTKDSAEPQVPEGLWIKCPKCKEMLYKEDVASNRYVCYKCGGYFRVKAVSTHAKIILFLIITSSFLLRHTKRTLKV